MRSRYRVNQSLILSHLSPHNPNTLAFVVADVLVMLIIQSGCGNEEDFYRSYTGPDWKCFNFQAYLIYLHLQSADLIGIFITSLSRTGRHLCTCPDMIGLVVKRPNMLVLFGRAEYPAYACTNQWTSHTCVTCQEYSM
jgi:hypothetical protein